jgi:adenosylcobinamide-GDP ribazoletransferase
MAADQETPKTGTGRARGLLSDLAVALQFLTRLPVPASDAGRRRLASTVGAFPLVGVIVGLLSSIVLMLGQLAGLPHLLTASLCVLSAVAITGALHEDGLADVADGFGGGATRERKLEIMRDSRIGTFGVLALVFVILIRVVAISTAVEWTAAWWQAPAVIVAAAALSRSHMALLMASLPAARDDWRSFDSGAPESASAWAGYAVGGGLCVVLIGLGLGFWTAVAGLIGAASAHVWIRRLAQRQIGGQTGDVLGTAQQLCEIGFLIAVVATLR